MLIVFITKVFIMRLWVPRIQIGAKLKYIGIVEAIEADIKEKLVKPGDRLPSQRIIAKQLNIDLSTVTRALKEASKRGLVETLKGSGSFIAQTAFSSYNSMSLTEGKMIDLSMNNPPHPSSINLQNEIAQGLVEISSHQLLAHQLNYQETAGNPIDREAGAIWLQHRMGNISGDQILVSSGAHSALFSIFSYLKNSCHVVAAPVLTYPGLRVIADHLELDVAGVAMDDDGIIPEDFERICLTRKPNVLYVIPNIDNPTTATLSEARRHRLIEIARKFDVTLIEDDPYAPFQTECLPTLYSLAPERTWHIATLSKCISPALRVAYVVAPDMSQALLLAEKMRISNLMAPPLMTALASHWIKNGTISKISNAIKTENSTRQALAASIFEKSHFSADPTGPHIWLKLPPHWRALEFTEYALLSGVSIVPSSAFVSDTLLTQAVRISLGGVMDIESLKNALTILANLIQQNKPRNNVIV